ncbi:hypothetical protein HPP92_004930 [Vanilla planifolia]|uniref:Uncharacterized protein n=1 Tax=Vanilla planifolia TaxID=51239 RepID=A0A835RSG2_VANPL|nr:hypothetical protein HPP92_004930 [Vanilla planifolia]
MLVPPPPPCAAQRNLDGDLAYSCLGGFNHSDSIACRRRLGHPCSSPSSASRTNPHNERCFATNETCRQRVPEADVHKMPPCWPIFRFKNQNIATLRFGDSTIAVLLPRCSGGGGRRSNVAGRRRRGRTCLDLKADRLVAPVPYGGSFARRGSIGLGPDGVVGRARVLGIF